MRERKPNPARAVAPNWWTSVIIGLVYWPLILLRWAALKWYSRLDLMDDRDD